MPRTNLAQFLGLLSAALILSGCHGGSEPSEAPNEQAVFPAPSTEEIEAVIRDWQTRDLAARGVVLLLQDDSPADYRVRIYEHKVGDNTHYGAVTIPKNALPGSVPVLLQADGLSQSDPTITIDHQLEMAGPLLQASIYVVPAFRGRTLIYKGLSWTATGDFCDAYDGATDDAIALLDVVEQHVEEANIDRVMTRGGSRGGAVALLLAQRDPRVKVAFAIAGPTDFNRVEVRVRLGQQYECQFIDGQSSEQSRHRILASSPLYFPVLPSVQRIHIFHGSEDNVVLVWNATDMAAALQAQGVLVDLRIFEGYTHSDLGSSADFRTAQREVLGAFIWAGE